MEIAPGEITCFMYAGKEAEAKLRKEKEYEKPWEFEPEPEQEIGGCIVPVPEVETQDPAVNLRGRLADLVHWLRVRGAKTRTDHVRKRED